MSVLKSGCPYQAQLLGVKRKRGEFYLDSTDPLAPVLKFRSTLSVLPKVPTLSVLPKVPFVYLTPVWTWLKPKEDPTQPLWVSGTIKNSKGVLKKALREEKLILNHETLVNRICKDNTEFEREGHESYIEKEQVTFIFQ